MTEPFETFEHAGFTIKLFPDYDQPDSPRDWCNATEMVCWHRRYDLGDRQPNSTEIDALERGGLRLLERYLRLCEGVVALQPLGLIDHSGISMYVGGGSHWCDPGGWDSGTVGFVYVPRDNICGTTEEHAADVLRQDVKVYDDFLRGNVAGYVIGDEKDDHLDSCWGFYPDAEGDGWDYLREEARSIAECFRAERDEAAETERVERERAANQDIATVTR